MNLMATAAHPGERLFYALSMAIETVIHCQHQ